MKTASLPEAAQKRIRFAIPAKFGIDPQTGVLTGLCLLTANREAIGHGIYIDQKTLEMAEACIVEDGGRLKGYVTHEHAGPCSWRGADMDEAASELNIPGFFSGIAINAAQLVAEKFEFYDAFKKNFAPQYEQLVEMAHKTPDLIALSIEAWGYAVYVDKDGNEYGGAPENTELLYNGLPAFRITEVWGAAFVGDGAATDGLFATFSRMFGGKHAEQRKLFKALAKAFRKMGKEEKEADASSVYNPSPITKTGTKLSEQSTMKIITDLKAKYGADPKKFAAAMSIVGHKPDSTMEAVEAEMVQADLAAVNGQLTKITADLSAANATITALTGERDTAKAEVVAEKAKTAELQTRFDTLKASGIDPVGTGALPGGGVSGEENPFLSDNLSVQAALLKADPARAKVLEAAAKAAKSAAVKK